LPGQEPSPSPLSLSLSPSRASVLSHPLPNIPPLPSSPIFFNNSELVSNASDALEKLRHKQVAGEAILDPSRPLAIRITTNEADNTITIADSGIGMDKPELIDHLGTIARSGSRAFMQRLREQQTSSSPSSSSPSPLSSASDTGANIIGQFGVGFYSAFMVSDSVTVYSQSAVPDTAAYAWTSTGDGSYEIAPAADVTRGCKVVMKLKETCRDFANPATVKDILTRYSNFVNFPIYLNDKQVNTVSAIWAASKSDVTEEQYTEFYKYKSGDFEAPLYRLHFAADAPTSIKALLYVGQSHDEKYGMGRMKPGVDLYSRKVLIQASSAHIMPDWLRFVHGVVDSEDIPLNISRESMQDSALMKRIKAVITRRVLRFLDAEARRDAEGFNKKFFPEFGAFLKEGCVTDATYSQDIAKLLRFESSANPAGTLTSLDEYISRMPVGQTSIYYLVAPHRGIAEASPYMEAFRGGKGGAAADVEVLFLYSPIDDFVMNNLREFGGRKLVTAETAELDPATLQGVKKDAAAAGAAAGAAGTLLLRLLFRLPLAHRRRGPGARRVDGRDAAQAPHQGPRHHPPPLLPRRRHRPRVRLPPPHDAHGGGVRGQGGGGPSPRGPHDAQADARNQPGPPHHHAPPRHPRDEPGPRPHRGRAARGQRHGGRGPRRRQPHDAPAAQRASGAGAWGGGGAGRGRRVPGRGGARGEAVGPAQGGGGEEGAGRGRKGRGRGDEEGRGGGGGGGDEVKRERGEKNPCES
jgi:TNF receptor-associated protein 1